MAPVRFTTSIDVAASAERVWQVMIDVDRWQEWTPSIASIARIGGVPFGIGMRARIRQPKLPPAVWTVTDVRVGRSFSWESRNPVLLATGVHEVTPVGDGSRVTLSLTLEGMLSGVMGRLTGGLTQRYIEHEAAGLKQRSEYPSYVHGAARNQYA